MPYASNGKARKTTLYVPLKDSASVAPEWSVNAGIAPPFGVIRSSNVALRTVWSSGTAPIPFETGLPVTPLTSTVALSFCVSVPSHVMCR